MSEATEEVEEYIPGTRSQDWLHNAHVEYIETEYGVNLSKSSPAEVISIAFATRREFRESEIYSDAKSAAAEAKEEAKAAASEARAEAKAERERLKAEAKAEKDAAAEKAEKAPAAKKGAAKAKAPAKKAARRSKPATTDEDESPFED